MPHGYDTYPPHDDEGLSLSAGAGDPRLERVPGESNRSPFEEPGAYGNDSRHATLENALKVFGADKPEKTASLSADGGSQETDQTERSSLSLGGGALRGTADRGYGVETPSYSKPTIYDRVPPRSKPTGYKLSPEQIAANRARMDALEDQRRAELNAKKDQPMRPYDSGNSGVTISGHGNRINGQVIEGDTVMHVDANENVTVREATDADRAAADSMRQQGQEMRDAARAFAEDARARATEAGQGAGDSFTDEQHDGVRRITGNGRMFNEPIAGRSVRRRDY